jgi:hypothetical protein
VLELDPNDMRYLRALARGFRRLPRSGYVGSCDIPFVVTLCLARGMRSLGKELEEALETTLDRPGDDEARPIPTGSPPRG